MDAKTSVLQYVFYWPCVLSIHVVCLEIIHSNPQGVLHVFLILEFSQNILIPFHQTTAICIYPSMPPGTCMFFWSKQVFQMLRRFLYDLMIAFHQRKSTASLALASVSTFFGSSFISPNRFAPSKLKAAISYPTVHFVSRRTQTRAFCLFVFETFAFDNSLFVSRL